MDIITKKINWNYHTLPSRTKKALDFLSKEPWLEQSKWYLAGGTSLALQSGNRKSFDLDFFTTEKDFNEKELVSNFANNKNWKTVTLEKNTIYGELLKAKVSFIAYPFFVPKQEFLWHGSIRILDKTDVAVMKIIAVSQRGRKRDFFDLYWCANNIEPLEKTIERLQAQYPSVAHDYHHILKSLVYFNDAEIDPNPEIFFKASWPVVKRYFEKEIPIITRRLMKLK